MSTPASSDRTKGRLWYFVGGGLLALIGIASIGRPGLASVAIEQFLGAFLIASGVVLLFSAAFGKAERHRILDLASSVLRIAVGVLLIAKVLAGVMSLTYIVASLFIAEGVLGLIFAWNLYGKNPAWIWVLLNAVAGFVLGGMLMANFPSDAAWALGLLFGINCLFLASSLIMFAWHLPQAERA